MRGNQSKPKERCQDCSFTDSFDPIRRIRVYGGKHKGWHNIYCSEKLFRKENPNYDKPIIRPYWEGSVGEWVFADDGYVVQILDKYDLINRFYQKKNEKKDTGVTTVFIFATRMARIYKRMDGTINANRFLGNYVPLYRNNINPESYNPLGRYMTERKRNFVMNLVAGLPPSIAYMKAYNVNYSLAKSRGYRLAMNDEEVLNEVRKQTGVTIFDDLDDAGMSGPEIIKYLKELVTSDATPAKVKSEIMLVLLRIKYRLDKDMQPTVKVEPKRLPSSLASVEEDKSSIMGSIVGRIGESKEEGLPMK